MIRFLIYGLGIYAAYRALKSRSASFLGAEDSLAPDDKSPASEELSKDPQCGAYFLKQQGVETTIGGKQLCFCSQKCSDKYMDEYKRLDA